MNYTQKINCQKRSLISLVNKIHLMSSYSKFMSIIKVPFLGFMYAYTGSKEAIPSHSPNIKLLIQYWWCLQGQSSPSGASAVNISHLQQILNFIKF